MVKRLRFPLLILTVAILCNQTVAADDFGFGQDKSRGTLDIFCTAPAVYGGNRNEQEISERIQLKMNYFANCYGTALTAQDEKSFKVRFRIIVKPAGNVSDVSFVFRGTKNDRFLTCLKNILSQMQFSHVSSAHGDCTVEQSIIFKII
jgi:hypothetical protein